ncbi:MAG: hypothetical protein A2V88_12885 [Elusimicrobia bacterium RBG_16_66_12]|nr:MAG: hypothetical protein A2V88_12885 [Elusimicrobia bacterium RBG_16_66_12]
MGLEKVMEWLPTIVAATVLFGWLAGSFQRGRRDGQREAIAVAVDELHVLKESRDRMAAELRDTRATVSKLEGRVEQLTSENEQLRRMVMLEKIPPAMDDALRTVVADLARQGGETARAAIEALVARVEERLHPIEQGMARLLAEGKG